MNNNILVISDNMPDQINGVVTTFKNVIKIGEKNGYYIYTLDPSYFRHFSMFKYPEVKIGPSPLPHCWLAYFLLAAICEY